MHAHGAGAHPPIGVSMCRRVEDAWDVATVVAEFDVCDHGQAAEVADLLFAAEDVLTVRVGGAGERSVYRVDVPREDPDVRALGAAPGIRVAETLGIGLNFVRIGITSDGVGDPEGSPPPADAVPWAAIRDRQTFE